MMPLDRVEQGRVEADPLLEILDAWDDLDAAINRTVTALPGQMTAASNMLEQERAHFRKLLHDIAFKRQGAKP